MGSGGKITLSVIKADVGGWVGHRTSYPEMLALGQELVTKAMDRNLLVDSQVLHVGDDVKLIVTHERGEENTEVHQFAYSTFQELAALAKRLKLYGARQDLLEDVFSDKGMGSAVVEMSFVERKSEPVVIFMANKFFAGAWNLPLFRMFGDPFNTVGLVIDPSMHRGFRFRVLDLWKAKELLYPLPEELNSLARILRIMPMRFAVIRVTRKQDTEPASVSGSSLLVRAEHGFPGLNDIVRPFAPPQIIQDCRWAPLMMPVPLYHRKPRKPLKVFALAYYVDSGKLMGPTDLFDSQDFDLSRREVKKIYDILAQYGSVLPNTGNQFSMPMAAWSLPDYQPEYPGASMGMMKYIPYLFLGWKAIKGLLKESWGE